MTVDLTKRLQDICVGFESDGDDEVNIYIPDWAIPEITQAFIDAKWIPPSEVEKWHKTVNVAANMAVAMHNMPVKVYVHVDKKTMTAKHLMTGRAWYDKFCDEAPASTEPHVFEAAKKAAGIES